MFDFDQVVAVSVDAGDMAGNVMSEYQYSFLTEMRAFGKNVPVSTLGGSANARPATARDPAGNLWVAWHGGPANSRDIYVAKRPLGSSTFQTPIRLTSDVHDQCNPALAISADRRDLRGLAGQPQRQLGPLPVELLERNDLL